MHDLIGDRGEAIFMVVVTRGYLFRKPRHFGEKMPVVDYYVEPVRKTAHPLFFLVQVKSTTRGYTLRDKRLKVAVASDEMQRLAAYPAPTYVVGIDVPAELGYIVSANGETVTGFSSMCTDHPLTADVLAVLRAEVESYWNTGPAAFSSAFLDPAWRQP
ncbi:MAG TPA: DUF4365 domain-containing protein [Longimicrobium sp.]|nr:DUF4365 domain-containing protein [Longimicrobium sp.]